MDNLVTESSPGRSASPVAPTVTGTVDDCVADRRRDEAARDAFTSEGGHVPPESAVEDDRAPARDERARLMQAFSIRHDGRHYIYNGYRYDRLEDGIAYAELMSSRQRQDDCATPSLQGDRIEVPSESDRRLMATLSICFEAGVYTFEGFHYDHLADAVNYAQRRVRKLGILTRSG